jgi:transcriptional regulator with XRE-family HTH domain
MALFGRRHTPYRIAPMPRGAVSARDPKVGAEAETRSQALGARIRAERRQAEMTVRGLASRIGVSPSLISQVERGRATPSVSTLFSIAEELGLSVADLFDDRGSRSGAKPDAGDGGDNGSKDARPASPVQPHDHRQAITLETGVRWERLTSGPDEEVDFVYMVYPVGAASCSEDAMMRHGGREYGYVLSGALGVKIGFEEYVVGPNDSISFDSTVPHRLWTIGDEPALAVWTVINRRGDPRGFSD